MHTDSISTMRFHASHRHYAVTEMTRKLSSSPDKYDLFGGFKRLQNYIVDSQWSYPLKYRLNNK